MGVKIEKLNCNQESGLLNLSEGISGVDSLDVYKNWSINSGTVQGNTSNETFWGLSVNSVYGQGDAGGWSVSTGSVYGDDWSFGTYGLVFSDNTVQTTAAIVPNTGDYKYGSSGLKYNVIENEDPTSLSINKDGVVFTKSGGEDRYSLGTGGVFTLQGDTYHSELNYEKVRGEDWSSIVTNFWEINKNGVSGNDDGRSSAKWSFGTNGLKFADGSTQASAFIPSNYLTSSSLNGYAQLSGATFTGKVIHSAGSTTAPINLGTGVTPSTGVAGDIWIATTSLSFKDSTNTTRTLAALSSGNNFTQNQTITVTSSASPSLTIIQNGNGGGLLVQNPTGTGYSFKVEDSTTPDATPFTIDSNGRVGIGVTPDATVALTVDSTGIKVNGATLVPASAVSNPPLTSGNMSHSEYLKELLITINGVSYAIPLRVV